MSGWAIVAPPFAGDRGTVSGGSNAGGDFSLAGLQADNSAGWRSAGIFPSQTWLSGGVDAAPWTQKADTIVLIGHNAESPLILSPRWRVRLDTLPIEARPPVAGITAVSNLTGAYPAIADNPDAPDGSYLAASSATTDTDVRVLFGFNNYRPWAAGAGLQMFRVLVSKGGGAGGTTPTLTLDLWDNGVFKANLLTGHGVTSTSGELVTVTWDASLLSSLSTGQPQLRIRGTAGTTATIEVRAVDFIAEYGGLAFDSGWTDIPRPSSNQNRNNLYATITAPSPVTAPQWWVDIDVSSHGSPVSGYPAPPSYFQASRLLIGQSWKPAQEILQGDLAVDWSNNTIRTRALSGTEWSEARREWRTITTRLAYLKPTEAINDWTDGIERSAQGGGHVFLSPLSDDPTTYSALNVYGTLKVTSSKTQQWVQFPDGMKLAWVKQVAVEEVVLP